MNKLFEGLLCGLMIALSNGCTSDEPPPGDDDSTDQPTPSPTPGPQTGDDDSTDGGYLPTPTPTPTPVPDALVGMTLFPASIQIDTASSLTYSAQGTMRYGSTVEVTDAEWTSSDPSVATVDDGTVTVFSEGTTRIQALAQGVTSAEAVLEVIAPGVLNVTVIDADTGQPVAGAEVYRGFDGDDALQADEQGRVLFTGEFSGPQTVTAADSDYHFATIQDAVSRNLVIPMRAWNSTLEGSFGGTTDFTGLDKLSYNEVRLGIMTRSFFGSPLALDTATIIGKNRDVVLCGYENIEIPSNIVGQAGCSTEDELETLLQFSVPGPTGLYDGYMLAGDLDIDTVFSWLDDEDIFTNLGLLLAQVPNLYEFGYYVQPGIQIEAFQETGDLTAAPAGVTNVPMTISIPSLPSGIDPQYLPVGFVIADIGDRGFLPIGLNGGEAGQNMVAYYPAEFSDYPLYGLVLASEDGVGNDGAYVAVMGLMSDPDEVVSTPAFMELLHPDTVNTDVAQRAFAFYGVSGSRLNRSVFSWKVEVDTGAGSTVKTYMYWDVYQPPSSLVTHLPAIPESPALDGKFNWEFFSYDTGARNFETFTAGVDITLTDSNTYLERMSRNKLYDVNSQL